jgi:hypothetical protein
MPVAEEKKSAFLSYYSICTLYGSIIGEPELHTGLDDDGYVTLHIKTTDGYKTKGDNETEVLVRVPEEEEFDSLLEDDEVQINGYLFEDEYGRNTLYAMIGKAYRNTDIIQSFDNT